MIPASPVYARDTIRQTARAIGTPCLIYLLASLVLLIPPTVYLILREYRWRRRERSLRALLDNADALEAQLHQCRERMQALRAMLVDLPEEMSADADEALAADDKVQAALRDLLQHRLWIQKHGADAPLDQLDNALGALGQSRAALGRQLGQLAEITHQLREARAR